MTAFTSSQRVAYAKTLGSLGLHDNQIERLEKLSYPRLLYHLVINEGSNDDYNVVIGKNMLED